MTLSPSSVQEVHSLLGRAQVDLAIDCLGSLLARSHDPLKLVLHDDGSLGPAEGERLLDALPGSRIFWRREADERAEERLRYHPAARRCRHDYVLGLKLLDTALFVEGDIAFCDSDIYFFRPFRGLFEFPSGSTAALFMMDLQNAYSVRAAELWGPRGIRLPRRLNSGLYLLRQTAYDLDFVEWFLKQPHFSLVPHWKEQTCWAMLGARVGCRQWRPQQIWMASSRGRPPSEMVAAHFAQPTRWLLPELRHRLSPLETASAIDIRTVPSRRCGSVRLAVNQLRNRWGHWRHARRNRG